MTSSYGFRPVTRADLPLLRGWLDSREARRWWGDPDTEYALFEEDLADGIMTMLIVMLDGRPFAYVQHCAIAAWPVPWLSHLPPATRALDALVGVPGMVGKGHGAQFMRQLAERLIAEGAPAVLIDPAPDNQRARRSFATAGFREDRVVMTDAGPAVLMLFDGQEAPATR